VNEEFWHGRRVLLTGHTGFKGGWAALWLERMGAKVTGFSLEPPSDPSLFEDARVAEGMDSRRGDVRDLAALAAAFDASDPEVVLHLAAQSLVHYGYRHPLETYSTNVIGTANVLEAARGREALAAVVIVTTDKCYRNDESGRPFREDDPLGGEDPYSSSKAAAEMVTAAYRAAYFSDAGAAAVASARAGNVIGGGDWAADRLLPDLVRGILAGEPTAIRRPQAIRPWQHVLEPVGGYLELAERLVVDGPAFAEAWNFGPDDADCRPVGWVADRLVELWGEGARWERDVADHPAEAHFLRLDCAKARERLGWRPRLPLERALEGLVAWHRARAAGEDVRQRTLEEIADYQALVSAA